MPSDNYIKLTALWEAMIKNPFGGEPGSDYKHLYDSLDIEERYAFRLHECSAGNPVQAQETDEDITEMCGSTKAEDKLACLESVMGQIKELFDDASNSVTEMRVLLSETLPVLEESAQVRKKIDDFETNPAHPKGPTTLQ